MSITDNVSKVPISSGGNIFQLYNAWQKLGCSAAMVLAAVLPKVINQFKYLF